MDAGPLVSSATGCEAHGRSVEALEKRADPAAPEPGASAAAVMAHRLSTKAGRTIYALRKQIHRTGVWNHQSGAGF